MEPQLSPTLAEREDNTDEPHDPTVHGCRCRCRDQGLIAVETSSLGS